jgi:hypothetical protein
LWCEGQHRVLLLLLLLLLGGAGPEKVFILKGAKKSVKGNFFVTGKKIN